MTGAQGTEAAGISVVIVEDEPFARADLRQLLAVHPEVTILGEAGSLAEGRALLAEVTPEVVFLDIELGDGSGFKLMEAAPAEAEVVFVTAYDRYALRAFEVNALDYLLKPVAPERLEVTIRRLLGRAPVARAAGATLALREDDRLLLVHNQGRRFVSLEEIVAIRSLGGNYSAVELEDGSDPAVRRTLKEWEGLLPESRFRRIHRATIANLGRVYSFDRLGDGTMRMLLRGREEPLLTSRRSSAEVRAALLAGAAPAGRR